MAPLNLSTSVHAEHLQDLFELPAVLTGAPFTPLLPLIRVLIIWTKFPKSDFERCIQNLRLAATCSLFQQFQSLATGGHCCVTKAASQWCAGALHRPCDKSSSYLSMSLCLLYKRCFWECMCIEIASVRPVGAPGPLGAVAAEVARLPALVARAP